jgi:thiamine biosynthesis protein ThiI
VQLDALVVHYHEIGLKGRNRNFFENQLTRNLKRALRGTGYERVRQGFGRVMIDFDPDGSPQEAAERAARVFGVAYVGLGVRVRPELEGIADVGLELMRAAPFESFAVRARRTYSTFPLTSNKINVEIGQRIVDQLDGKVDLSAPDATLTIELFGSTGIVFRDRRRGPGGLPAGVSGRMLALLSGGIDSPVAAWRMARRGAEIELVHFHGRPFTDPSSIRQATDLAAVFTRYHLRTALHLIPLGELQREIVTHAPSELRVVLYRRAMMRISSELAKQREAKAIITGDALGQVASQTIENITTVDAAQEDTPVLRPLIGMDKQEIVDLAKQIGTYEISTRQYQDCCVLFEPKSPATRANAHIAEAGESELDMDALVGKALAGIETTVLDYPAPP